MTTIFASFTEGVMVSDSKTTDGEVKWSAEKIERVGASLYGAAGECTDIEMFMRWIRRKGARPKLTDGFIALELNKEGLWLWDKKLSAYPPGRAYHACGTGAMAALAANMLGCDARRSVEIACEIDDGSGLPLQIYYLNEEGKV